MNEYYDGEWTLELQACADLSVMSNHFACLIHSKEWRSALALLNLQPQANELMTALAKFHAHLEEKSLRLTSEVH
jgi:hypothetical protein